MNPSVELIATGSELLNGRVVNTHAATLARGLASCGLALARETTLPDDAALIRETVAAALERSAVVVVSGGLGPTSDDMTRDVVAGLLGRGIAEDPAALQRVRAFCQARGVSAEGSRRRQAAIVEGAEVLPNRVGAAPGELLAVGKSWLCLLPGPADEFEAVLEDGLLPRLRREFLSPSVSTEKIFMVCGLGESDLCELFERHAFPEAGVSLAFCSSPGQVEVRLTSPARELLEREAARLRGWCGEAIFAEESTSLEAVVADLLRNREATLSVAESCTGGLIGRRLTDVPGISASFPGGVIAYADGVKTRLLGIPEDVLRLDGAVSESVAGAMASGVREVFRTDYGLAVTGIAGPGGGSKKKPVGLVYAACADREGVEVSRFLFSGNRLRVRTSAAQMALDLVRQVLLCAPAKNKTA